MRKTGKGVAMKGPAILPAAISFVNFAKTMSGRCNALCKFGDSNEDKAQMNSMQKTQSENRALNIALKLS